MPIRLHKMYLNINIIWNKIQLTNLTDKFEPNALLPGSILFRKAVRKEDINLIFSPTRRQKTEISIIVKNSSSVQILF